MLHIGVKVEGKTLKDTGFVEAVECMGFLPTKSLSIEYKSHRTLTQRTATEQKQF